MGGDSVAQDWQLAFWNCDVLTSVDQLKFCEVNVGASLMSSVLLLVALHVHT